MKARGARRLLFHCQIRSSPFKCPFWHFFGIIIISGTAVEKGAQLLHPTRRPLLQFWSRVEKQQVQAGSSGYAGQQGEVRTAKWDGLENVA